MPQRKYLVDYCLYLALMVKAIVVPTTPHLNPSLNGGISKEMALLDRQFDALVHEKAKIERNIKK